MLRLAPVPYCTKWLGSVSVGKKKQNTEHSVAQSAPFSVAAGRTSGLCKCAQTEHFILYCTYLNETAEDLQFILFGWNGCAACLVL